MSTSMKLKNVERKIKDYNISLTQFEEQFIIVPFVPTGFVDYSNFGQLESAVEIDQFETYKRLYTGNDAFIITWKNSVQFDYSNQQDNTQNTTSSIQLKWGVGEILLGWIENDTTENDISTDTSFTEYKSQKSITSYTFRINAAKFQLTEEYSYYFYKIPEISNQILFKVVSLEKEYIGKDLVCYVLRLESLQDTLANTGRAKAENVMPNAPGQGYLQPQVVNQSEYTLPDGAVENVDYVDVGDNQRYVIANKIYQQNNPVKSIIVKLFGLAILCNVSLIGRRAYLGGDFTQYGNPRLIFPINFTSPTTITLYRTQQAETNFYWAINLFPDINFTSDIFDRLKNFLDFNKFWSQQGLMKIDKDQTQATNPQINGSYGYELYGQQTSNGYQQWMVEFDTKSIDTSYTYGCASSYTIGGNKVIHDHMFDCYWIQKQVATLPIKESNTLNFGWTVGATYAAAVAGNITTAFGLFLIGIAATLYQKYTALPFQGVYGLIPASLCDFMMDEAQTTLGSSDDDISMKLSYFLDGDGDTGDFAKFFKTSSMNTSFQADLTDIIQDSSGNQYVTDQIGQTTNADGSNIKSDGTALLMDGSYSLVANNTQNLGYIIDSFNIQAVFSGDFSVEFLDMNGQVIWYGVYQSEAKWTGSIREINTWKETSIFGRENQYLGKPLAWPKDLQPLDPDGSTPNLTYPNMNIGYKWKITCSGSSSVWGNGFNETGTYYREELNNFRTNKYSTGFTNWTGTQHTTDNGDLDLAGYLSGGNSDLGTIAVSTNFTNIQQFLNYYNKAKFSIKWDWSISNITTNYPNDSFVEINVDEFSWVKDSDTTTEWVSVKVSASNQKIRYGVMNVLNGNYTNNGVVAPGVYDYAGPVWVETTSKQKISMGGLTGSPAVQDNQEFTYNIDIDFKVRLEIQSNAVVLHFMTNNNKFEWVNPSGINRTAARGWLGGSGYIETVASANIPSKGITDATQEQLSFQILLDSIELIRDF